ncbi:hypothetical protein ADIARSV_3007 [Arcticibacter svalbardensis MN12-7]|uniref:SnoaL-like domain-containing protein n=1 Tax=Arcticibacter svalbardensis MN12-7 TaxID=1150600 RepID=R9GQP7_9SPHI|nr:hypothetical protein [Arcticibacter svalbardensis]EOR93870.1 hypothetical protein ADIARSV_3007 [Arcticibacter svalbardensis MN12-7]
MKKLFLILLAGTLFSCSNKQKAADGAMGDTSANAEQDYPYSIKHPDNWEVGSTANTLIALKALKAWENGKMDESTSYFGDTVHVEFDALDEKMPRDSVKAMFNVGWNMFKTVNIKMYDWESVVSKDKSEEWVTVWYTQNWETKKGVKDSLAVINDLQLKDGKIIRLSEYTRKLH